MGKIQPLALKFIVGILIILFSITGCSDMPYTGSVLPVHEVDRYLVSTDGNVVCFQDGIDSTCLNLIPETQNGGPAIHIYPERRLYLFYHEGNPILRAERVGDPPQNEGGGNQDDNNGNNNGDNNGNNGDGNNNGNNNGGNPGGTNGDNNNGGGGDNGNGDNPGGTNGDDGDNNDNPPDNSDDGHGWIIWVYYPEGTAPRNSPTLSESGVTVTINGKQLTDDDITGFAQFIGPNNEVGVQFFYETKSAELLDLKVRMEGVLAADDPVKFNINYLWNSQ